MIEVEQKLKLVKRLLQEKVNQLKEQVSPLVTSACLTVQFFGVCRVCVCVSVHECVRVHL